MVSDKSPGLGGTGEGKGPTDIIRLQLLKRITHTHMNPPARVPGKVGRLVPPAHGRTAIIHTEFGGQHHRVPVLTGLHPFADPRLRLPGLVGAGRVNEVTPSFVVGVQKFEGRFFAH